MSNEQRNPSKISLITEHELDDMYREMLDDTNEGVTIAGFEYSTSYALFMVDRTAYDIGFNNYVSDLEEDGNIFLHSDNEYYLTNDAED